MPEDAVDISPPIRIERWPSELPLRAAVWFAALGIWFLIMISIVGVVYGLLIGVFLFVGHLSFIAYLRGNAVRLGPDQMPELYERVVALSYRVGLRQPPDAYIMQAGGRLNALATKFFRGISSCFSPISWTNAETTRMRATSSSRTNSVTFMPVIFGCGGCGFRGP